MILRFIEGNEARAIELRRIVPALQFELAELSVGYATAAPDPQLRARDMVMAAAFTEPSFAEAVNLTTRDGKSLRLELDSENDTRFCRWWRETPATLHLCVALRRGADAPVELFAAECEGRIADQPAGTRALGLDRLFIPEGFQRTMAQITDKPGDDDPDPVGLRGVVYGDLARALGIIVD